jgi:tetratricopeptide (TPR) repeat protein
MTIFAALLFLSHSNLKLDDTPAIKLYEGIGHYRRAIRTSNSLSAKYGNQGLEMLYGFDYDRSRTSFQEATKLDPNQVFGYWGLAMTHGNTINWSGVDANESTAALDALKKARANSKNGTPVENALVEAAILRFDPSGPNPRLKLDQAYSDAMRKLYEKYPNDPDVAAIFAESILNLRPWKQWTLDGKPEPGTEEAMAVLRHALDLNQNHPQALHLWIHTLEGSKEPARALAEAYRLYDLQPDLPHMQHMPSHIFDRAGKYKDAIDSNLKSVAASKRNWGNGSYGKYLDFTHGRHMLIHSAAMRGQSELSFLQLNQMFDGIPTADVEKLGGNADYYLGMKYMLLVRFGRWQEILSSTAPAEKFHFARAMRWEATGVAQAALKDPVKAREAQKKYLAEMALDDPKPNDENIYPVASSLLEGEILIAEGKRDTAIEELKKAVIAEDKLPYSEPPNWIQPTRHTLGAALVESGRFKEAVATYQDDLKDHPENGWALYGLYRAYTGLKQDKDAAKALARFKLAWADADISTTSSCMCMPEKKN